jgi:hypothetical protein
MECDSRHMLADPLTINSIIFSVVAVMVVNRNLLEQTPT